MKKIITGAIATGVVAALSLLSPSIAAENMSFGQREFNSSCSACHGVEADGKGPMAGLMTMEVPDLTMLAKNNGGVFPMERVYSIIDGRADVASHGTRDMPIWGARYKRMMAEQPANEMLDDQTFGAMARARILAIVDYLYSVQQK